jgi:Cu-Zn family superoxide dismutase
MTRIGCLLLLPLSACIVGDAGMHMNMGSNKAAKATIAPTDGNTVTGEANFTIVNNAAQLAITVSNAPPGEHGFHIHLNPACGNNGMDAGPHWDGGAASGDPATHGLPGSGMTHAGDVGNVTVGADGNGTKTMTSSVWTIGDGGSTDVVGHSVIFHTAMDTGAMPSAGARMGCGIIELLPES